MTLLKRALKQNRHAFLFARRLKHRMQGPPEAELTLLPLLVDPARTAIDIGAHAGLYTEELLRLTQDVVAVEAIPELAQSLARLLPRAHVLNIAASSSAGQTTLTIPDGMPGLSSLRDDHFDGSRPVRKLTVETRTVDQIVTTHGRPVGFIKIDVEGHELEVLKGAAETLATQKPTLLIEAEERHSPGAVAAIGAMLAKLGYAGFFLDRGVLRSMASFDLAVHQRFDSADTRALDSGHADYDYVNNFIFVA